MDKTALSRLLHLYPVEAIREHWEMGKRSGKDELVALVVEQLTPDEIATFCRLQHGRTKQHVLLFENIAGAAADLGDPVIDTAAPVFVKRTQQKIEEFYLLPIEFAAVVGPPYEDVTLKFLWPVAVIADATTVQLAFTTIEKKLSVHLGTNLRVLGVKRDTDHDEVVALVRQALPTPDSIKRIDFNKGIKKLWSDDYIDAEHSRWKGAKSTQTETMDVKCLLKRDDPAAYQRAIQAPLMKTVFKTVAEKTTYPSVFTVEPSAGEVIVSRYGQSADEVQNVVRAILAAN